MTLHIFGDAFCESYVVAETIEEAANELEVEEDALHQLSDNATFGMYFGEEPTDLPDGENAVYDGDCELWRWMSTAAKVATYVGKTTIISEDEE